MSSWRRVTLGDIIARRVTRFEPTESSCPAEPARGRGSAGSRLPSLLCWVIRRLVDAFSRRECTMTGEPPDASWSTAAGSLATRLGIFPERFGGADSGVGVDDIGSVGFVASPWEEAVKQRLCAISPRLLLVSDAERLVRRAGRGVGVHHPKAVLKHPLEPAHSRTPHTRGDGCDPKGA